MASVWGELKRRNVVRVAIAYAIVSWLLLQVADVILNNIEAPTWVFQAILLLLVIGLPVALIFAWAFELTPEGLKKESDVDRSESITHITGRKLDFVIIGVLVVAVGVLFAANTLIKIPPIVSQTSKSDDDITLRRFTIDLPKSMQFTASTGDKQTMRVRQTLAQSTSAPLLASSGPTAPLSLPPRRPRRLV